MMAVRKDRKPSLVLGTSGPTRDLVIKQEEDDDLVDDVDFDDMLNWRSKMSL